MADAAAGSRKFLNPAMGPADAEGFEDSVEKQVRERARTFVDWCFNALQSEAVKALPQQVEHLGQRYRRPEEKTPHTKVLTRFGDIRLTRATYRQGSHSRTIAPLEKVLGIECGATLGAQDLVGRQVAATGSLQGRSIDLIAERTGARIGVKKLRNLNNALMERKKTQRKRGAVGQSG